MMIFFVVMPALIGGYLRHGRVDNGVYFYFISGISVSSLIPHWVLHRNLNTEKGSNKVLFEGCKKWVKAQNIDKEYNTLDLTLVIFLSLTIVNYCCKNGSAIPKFFDKSFWFRGKQYVKDIPKTVCSKTTNIVNTITEKNLKLYSWH